MTVWRWLSADAISPWNTARGFFPATRSSAPRPGGSSTSTEAAGKASCSQPGDFVVCCDEKPSIQATAPPARELAGPGAVGAMQRVEHEYERKGRSATSPGWDAPRRRLRRCAADGIVPFDALVAQFMSVEPYSKAQRVFRDATTAPHTAASAPSAALRAPGRTDLRPHPGSRHLAQPVRDLLLDRPTEGAHPNNFDDLDTLEQTPLSFGRRYEEIATPSNGSSPAATSTTSPNASTRPSPKQPDRDTSANFRARALRSWVRRVEVDQGSRPGLTTDERAKLKELERENRELKRANEILKSASLFFATELDGRTRRS